RVACGPVHRADPSQPGCGGEVTADLYADVVEDLRQSCRRADDAVHRLRCRSERRAAGACPPGVLSLARLYLYIATGGDDPQQVWRYLWQASDDGGGPPAGADYVLDGRR